MAEEPWTALLFTLYQGLTCANCALRRSATTLTTTSSEPLFSWPLLSLVSYQLVERVPTLPISEKSAIHQSTGERLKKVLGVS